MRPATRKAILFTILFGIVGYLVVDSEDSARLPNGTTPVAGTRESGGGQGESSAQARAERYALPERAALGTQRADLFGTRSWQPPSAPSGAAARGPSAPRVPPLPYRYAGQSLHEGQMKVYLAKGDRVFPIRAGDTLEGTYRVQEIEKTRITLLYLPLGRKQTIPVKAKLPLAQAPARTSAAGSSSKKIKRAAQPSPAGVKSARVMLEGPKQVKLGAPFSVAVHVTSAQPVAASPMQIKFDPKLLETVAVKPGRFFEKGRDTFSVRVSPEGSIFVGAKNDARLPASDAEFLVLTFRPIKPAAVAELSVAALSLQGPAGRAIEFDSPAAFRTAITP